MEVTFFLLFRQRLQKWGHLQQQRWEIDADDLNGEGEIKDAAWTAAKRGIKIRVSFVLFREGEAVVVVGNMISGDICI